MTLVALDQQYRLWQILMDMDRDFAQYKSEILRGELDLEDSRAELKRLELFLNADNDEG